MRKLKIITVQPNDLLYNWTLRVQLTNFRKYELTYAYTAIVWIPYERIGVTRGVPDGWMELVTDFPEVEFVFIYDEENYIKTIQAFGYIPLLRPHCLAKYFKANPKLKEDAIFYIDADVVLTKPLDLDKFLDDDVCYVSQAGHYINATYFDSKIKDVLPERLEAFKKIDVLGVASRQLSISREICEKNNDNSGAAQYLLKNIDEQFWLDVLEGCMKLNIYLVGVNKKYFESENKGFQRWCADIWAVLWNLWKRGMETKCPPELDFAWATDPIKRWDEVSIYHDAGASKHSKLFHKRQESYINNINTPFDEDLSWVDPAYCSYNYVKEILNCKK